MAKRYYWLKLMNDFFTQPKIKKLRRIAGGDTYTIIYLKMQLLSLKNNGKLFFDGIEDSFPEEIALTIDEDTENVNVTIQYLLSQGLMEKLSEDEYLMTETQYLIGSECDSASRVRKHRSKKSLPSNDYVTNSNALVTDCNTDIDIEIDKDIDKDIDISCVRKNKKKDTKHKYGEYQHVRLSDSEKEKLFSEYGEGRTAKAIKYLDEYIETSGKKYKNHYLVMKKWVFDAVKDKPEEKKTGFSNFKERDYDMESLERRLLRQ